jgi:hypothetical protein
MMSQLQSILILLKDCFSSNQLLIQKRCVMVRTHTSPGYFTAISQIYSTS